jgi:hypothetical protein
MTNKEPVIPDPDTPLAEVTPKRYVPEVKKVRPPVQTGRKTTLTPELVKEISDTLRICATMADTASYLGVPYGTMQSWIRKGNEVAQEAEVSGRELTDNEHLFVSLSVEVEKARAEARIRAVGKIRTAMDGNWQAAAWYLERSKPDEWARVSRTELSGINGESIKVDVDAVNRKLEALIQANIIDAEVVEGPEFDMEAELVSDAVEVVVEEVPKVAKKTPRSHEPRKKSQDTTPPKTQDAEPPVDGTEPEQASTPSDVDTSTGQTPHSEQ